MLVKVRQRFPNFAQTLRPIEADCASVEDVYNIPFVQRWTNEPTFHKLCKSTHTTGSHLLICETNRGKSYWAIAFLEGDIEELQLPEWRK